MTMTMVQRNMKAQLLVTLAACNVIILLPSVLVQVACQPTRTTNEDADEITGLEENTLLNSPDFISLPLDENYKKRTKLSTSSQDNDDDEVMQTAETYFRPLSRYRELQKEKEQKKKEKYGSDNEVAAAAHAPVVARPPNTNRVYNTKLLSKNPEYCLPVKNGVVCFYKV
ncbi:uncharacterized protein LOC135847639 [Planococcus citri]|uniref:uncharacterized protein LOC135847639 n=1 Tax=Planococcus citri TaxID=170843 RepID=UPI0031F885B7